MLRCIAEKITRLLEITHLESKGEAEISYNFPPSFTNFSVAGNKYNNLHRGALPGFIWLIYIVLFFISPPHPCPPLPAMGARDFNNMISKVKDVKDMFSVCILFTRVD